MYDRFIKRLLDIVLSFSLLIILIPLNLIITICVLCFLGRPILFEQDRIGKDEKTFKLYKFRTMSNKKDENGNMLDECYRHTKFGDLLRSLSLDELPELWSIFIGKMSFVGPRPLPTYYGPYFFQNERQRHKVRGGLIPPDGLSGKTTPSWEKQFDYDLYYVNNVSFVLDVKVVFVTFKILVDRVLNNYGAENRPHLNEYRANIINKKESNVNE